MMRARLLLPLLLCACVQLPQQDRIEDLRVLGIKADPPELLYSFVHLLTPEQRAGLPVGPYELSVQVLAVDPKGRVVELSRRLCPEEVEGPCKGYRIRDEAPPEEIRAMTPLVQPVLSTLEAQTSLGGELEPEPVRYTISERAMDYMLPRDARGNISLTAMLFPAFPSFVVRVNIPGTEEQEIAFKRFALSLDTNTQGLPPELAAPLEQLFVGALGFEFCPPDTDPFADVQCLKPRTANRNPTIVRLLYSEEGDGFGGGGFGGGGGSADAGPPDPTSGGRFKDVPPRLTVAQGSSVVIRPIMAEGDHEPYQQFAFDGDTGAALLLNYVEDMAFTWYTTHGSTNLVTSEAGGFGPRDPWADGTVSINPDAPTGAASVWIIARDQRGGMDWRRVDLEVVESAGAQIGGPLGF